MTKSWTGLLTVIALLAVISVSYRFLHEEIAVDRCLSGLHGSFDYSTMSCDLKENHIYVPYHARHPHDLQLLALALGTMTIALLVNRAKL
jgi:hypothetical protein